MAADWYCEIDGEQHGPVTAAQLKQLAAEGKLKPSHPVWKEGMQKTVPAQTVKGLFDAPAANAITAAPAPGASKRPAPAPAPQEVEELIEFELVEEEVAEAEIVEEVEFELVAGPPEPKKDKEKERGKDKESGKDDDNEEPPVILAEVEVTYREGHPDLTGPVVGTLVVESTGLRFAFERDEEEDEFRLSFEKIENVLEPAKGDFPQTMKRKALGAKLGGKAGKLAAGLVGRWVGGTTGDLVEKAGKGAGGMAEQSGDLGKPPRNRIVVLARLRKQRCKLVFDVHGADRDEMTEEAKILYKQIQKARGKFTSASETGETNINVVINEAPGEEKAAPEKAKGGVGGAALAAAAPTAGKPFRVMSGGRVRGPFSLQEIRNLLAAGKIGDGDLIGVETWLPVATLGGLVEAGAGTAKRGGAAKSSSEAAEQEEETGDFEMVEEDEDTDDADAAEDEAPAAKNDEDMIPVDDEFQLG